MWNSSGAGTGALNLLFHRVRRATRIIAAQTLLVATLSGLSSVSAAQGTTYYYPGDAEQNAFSTEQGPEQSLREGMDRLANFLGSTRNPTPVRVRAFLNQEIAPNFDFVYMARWAAGPMYRRLTDQQKDAFTARVTDLFLGALARNLGAYTLPLPHVEVHPARQGRASNEAIIRTEVIPLDGYAIELDFRYYLTGAGWRIYDVSANGASAIAYYRGYFTKLLRRHGPAVLLK